MLCTPSYISPEQIRVNKVDGLTYIFSVGFIIYKMTAGNRPFLGELHATVSNRILSQMPYGVADSGFRFEVLVNKFYLFILPSLLTPFFSIVSVPIMFWKNRLGSIARCC